MDTVMRSLGTSFSQPMWLWLLLLLPSLPLLTLLTGSKRHGRFVAGFGHRAAALTRRRKLGSCLLRQAISAAGLTLLIIASAGPQWGVDGGLALVPGRDIVLVLDLSRSMLAEDILPQRLGRARQAAQSLLTAIEEKGGHRVGIVVFAAKAKILCPLTHDYDHAGEILAELDIQRHYADLRPIGIGIASGTRIGEGLMAAVALHESSRRGVQDIILISDGDDPALDGEWIRGIAAARSVEIPVHCVGLGKPESDTPLQIRSKQVLTRLYEEPLKAIASRTGGEYFPLRTGEPRLGEWFTGLISAARKDALPGQSVPVPRPRHGWFIAGAVLFLGLGMVLPWRGTRNRGGENARSTSASHTPAIALPHPAAMMLLAVCLCAWAATADPSEAVRRGNRALREGSYSVALEAYADAEIRTDDPGLVAFNKGVAFYALGQYREAELHFRRCLEDAQSERRRKALYNLATCLLRAAVPPSRSQLREAIACFQASLTDAHEPEFVADAGRNLELARLLLLATQDKRDDVEPPSREPESEHSPPSQGARRQQAGPVEDGSPGRPGGASQKTGVRTEEGKGSPIATEQTTPGRGNLPPIPDVDELQRLPREDALEHLRRAANRIANKSRIHYQRPVPPPAPNVKEW